MKTIMEGDQLKIFDIGAANTEQSQLINLEFWYRRARDRVTAETEVQKSLTLWLKQAEDELKEMEDSTFSYHDSNLIRSLRLEMDETRRRVDTAEKSMVANKQFATELEKRIERLQKQSSSEKGDLYKTHLKEYAKLRRNYAHQDREVTETKWKYEQTVKKLTRLKTTQQEVKDEDKLQILEEKIRWTYAKCEALHYKYQDRIQADISIRSQLLQKSKDILQTWKKKEEPNITFLVKCWWECVLNTYDSNSLEDILAAIEQVSITEMLDKMADKKMKNANFRDHPDIGYLWGKKEGSDNKDFEAEVDTTFIIDMFDMEESEDSLNIKQGGNMKSLSLVNLPVGDAHMMEQSSFNLDATSDESELDMLGLSEINPDMGRQPLTSSRNDMTDGTGVSLEDDLQSTILTENEQKFEQLAEDLQCNPNDTSKNSLRYMDDFTVQGTEYMSNKDKTSYESGMLRNVAHRLNETKRHTICRDDFATATADGKLPKRRNSLSGHPLPCIQSEPSTDAAHLRNVYVTVVKEYKKTDPTQISLHLGSKLKQILPANIDGMAFGYKRTGLKKKKKGFYPISHVNYVETDLQLKQTIERQFSLGGSLFDIAT